MSEEEKVEDDNVEVDLDSEEKEEESKKQPEPEVVPEVEAEEAPAEALVEDKPKRSTKFQKRIDDLTKKQREAERQ